MPQFMKSFLQKQWFSFLKFKKIEQERYSCNIIWLFFSAKILLSLSLFMTPGNLQNLVFWTFFLSIEFPINLASWQVCTHLVFLRVFLSSVLMIGRCPLLWFFYIHRICERFFRDSIRKTLNFKKLFNSQIVWASL